MVSVLAHIGVLSFYHVSVSTAANSTVLQLKLNIKEATIVELLEGAEAAAEQPYGAPADESTVAESSVAQYPPAAAHQNELKSIETTDVYAAALAAGQGLLMSISKPTVLPRAQPKHQSKAKPSDVKRATLGSSTFLSRLGAEINDSIHVVPCTLQQQRSAVIDCGNNTQPAMPIRDSQYTGLLNGLLAQATVASEFDKGMREIAKLSMVQDALYQTIKSNGGIDPHLTQEYQQLTNTITERLKKYDSMNLLKVAKSGLSLALNKIKNTKR